MYWGDFYKQIVIIGSVMYDIDLWPQTGFVEGIYFPQFCLICFGEDLYVGKTQILPWELQWRMDAFKSVKDLPFTETGHSKLYNLNDVLEVVAFST